MPQKTAREDDHVGVAAGRSLCHELEAALGVRAATAPLRAAVARLPELDDCVRNRRAGTVEDMPDEPHCASWDDLVLRIAAEADREERSDRL